MEIILIIESLWGLHPTEGDTQEVIINEGHYKVFTQPLVNEDGVIDQCLFLGQDVTEMREAQQALEAVNVELKAIATRDGLLNIANRREFERVLNLEWRREKRCGRPIGLLMIDVDHFKVFNDSYGHVEGDDCLKKVAKSLSKVVGRPGDLLARYGGEEMAMLLPNTDKEGLLMVAQRLHEALYECAIPFDKSPVSDRVTVSIGAACIIPDKDKDPMTFVQVADEALYKAKLSGRNQTKINE